MPTHEQAIAEAFRNVFKSVYSVNPPAGLYTTLAEMEAFLARDWSAEIDAAEAESVAFIAACEAEEAERRTAHALATIAAAEAAEDAWIAAVERGALRRVHVLPFNRRS